MFGNGDYEGNFGFDSFEYCGGGVSGWDEDGGGGWFVGKGGEGLADGGEGGDVRELCVWVGRGRLDGGRDTA